MCILSSNAYGVKLALCIIVVVQQLFTLLIVLCFLLNNTFWKSPRTCLEITLISLGETPIIERIREPV